MIKKAYSAEECYAALKLANEICNKEAAERLVIKLDTLYTWISKAKPERLVFVIIQGNVPIEDANRLKQLEKELWEAKEKIEILQDALVFLSKAKEIAKQQRMSYTGYITDRRAWHQRIWLL